MLVDFRLRPPTPGFAKLGIFDPPRFCIEPHNLMTDPIPSALEMCLDMFMEELELSGVTKGVLMGRSTPATVDCAPNDDVERLAAAHPDLFIPFAGIDLSNGISSALEEVDRCILQRRFMGIALDPALCEPPLKPDAAQLYPVYARCDALNIPVVVSMSFNMGPDLSYSAPETIQRVAKDFPSLQIVVAQAAYPHLLGMFTVALSCKNIWLLPSAYMHNPVVPGSGLFKDAVQYLDGERILFGSSYPIRSVAQSLGDIERLQLSEKHREKLLFKNAATLLGLDL